MKILAIESSCDETSAAVIEGTDFPAITKNIIASQIDVHATTGGVVPEVAARMHAEAIIPTIEEALGGKIATQLRFIDVIAVTYGPGLLGSLLIGVEAAKALAYANSKPLLPINHMEGHIAAALYQIPKQEAEKFFPILCLTVSGGHSELTLVKDYGKYEIIGQTKDDAAGEAYDKVAVLLGLGYPGGVALSKLAEAGNPAAFEFPRPLSTDNTLNFSFSGLKTAVRYTLEKNKHTNKADVAASFQEAVCDVLLLKAKRAMEHYNTSKILLTGGVAANTRLRTVFEAEFGKEKLITAPKELCGDNAGMIGLAAWHHVKQAKSPMTDFLWQAVDAKPGAELV